MRLHYVYYVWLLGHMPLVMHEMRNAAWASRVRVLVRVNVCRGLAKKLHVSTKHRTVHLTHSPRPLRVLLSTPHAHVCPRVFTTSLHTVGPTVGSVHLHHAPLHPCLHPVSSPQRQAEHLAQSEWSCYEPETHSRFLCVACKPAALLVPALSLRVVFVPSW